jgi:hypothetical protein
MKNKSPGHDGLCAEPIKAVSIFIVPPLVHIFNLSFSQGIVPFELKIAQVVPLYKKGSPRDVSNYRPISLLPLFSKILEKLVHKRVYNFLIDKNLLSPQQFGFQKGKNTTQALITVIDKITRSFERSEVTVGVLLDFQKAFDTVQHPILLAKLSKYGIRGLAHQWFSHYLTNRQQKVIFNGSTSSTGLVTCGVPQGSILGPLLFLLYINDLSLVSNRLYLTLFADDTNAFASAPTADLAITIVNDELAKLNSWLIANRLSLNIDKTKYLIFTPSRTINNHQPVKLDNKIIEVVNHASFLGVILDKNLRWDLHISHIRQKISRSLGIFLKINKIFPLKTIRSLYHTLVYPHLIYCIEVWGAAAQTHLLPLIKLQKKVVRLMTSSGYRDHTAILFTKLELLTVEQLYIYHVLIFMFKFTRNLLPNVFNQVFHFSPVPNYNLRRPLPFTQPPFRLTVSRRSISYSGPKLFNEYHGRLELSVSLNLFKSKIKTMALNNIY